LGGSSNFNVSDTFDYQGGIADVHEPLGYGTPGVVGQLLVTGTDLTVWGLINVPGGVAVAANAQLQLRMASLTGDVTNNGALEMQGGTIVGDLVNFGAYHFGRPHEILPFDYVTIDGDFVQGSSGTLILDVGSGSASDGLTVSGTAQLAGALVCQFMPEWVMGPSYLLISAETRLGTFDAWSLPADYKPWYDGGNMGIEEV
jgi:hypothetical protein